MSAGYVAMLSFGVLMLGIGIGKMASRSAATMSEPVSTATQLGNAACRHERAGAACPYGDQDVLCPEIDYERPAPASFTVAGAGDPSQLRVEVRDGAGALLTVFVAKEPFPSGPFQVTVLLDQEPVAEATLVPVRRRG